MLNRVKIKVLLAKVAHKLKRIGLSQSHELLNRAVDPMKYPITGYDKSRMLEVYIVSSLGCGSGSLCYGV